LQAFPGITEVAGITTRPMREGEIQGKSSHYITLEQFQTLEKQNQLTLIKEFFGNKYAWFKSDLINDEQVRIINISYKSIEELKQNGTELFSIFIKPGSEEQLRISLEKRNMSQSEFEKRMRDYYESEKFISQYPNLFDLIFVNTYDEKSTYEFLSNFADQFILNKTLDNQSLEMRITQLLQINKDIDHEISDAESIIREQQRRLDCQHFFVQFL
jgi:guanylate kinase